MLDYQTLILRINEMHQALATLPVNSLDAAIECAYRNSAQHQARATSARFSSSNETVGIVLSALAHSSYYADRAFVYPTLLILRALHDAAQEQHVQWASQLTPWEASFPAEMIDELIPYYSKLSIYGLIGIVATESREEPDTEYLEWLHRALMHICIFCHLRGIDLISEIRWAYRSSH